MPDLEHYKFLHEYRDLELQLINSGSIAETVRIEDRMRELEPLIVSSYFRTYYDKD